MACTYKRILACQYDLYGFVPNAPATLRQPPPNKKGASYDDLMEALPNKKDTANQIAVANLLSMYSHDEVRINVVFNVKIYNNTSYPLLDIFG